MRIEGTKLRAIDRLQSHDGPEGCSRPRHTCDHYDCFWQHVFPGVRVRTQFPSLAARTGAQMHWPCGSSGLDTFALQPERKPPNLPKG